MNARGLRERTAAGAAAAGSHRAPDPRPYASAALTSWPYSLAPRGPPIRRNSSRTAPGAGPWARRATGSAAVRVRRRTALAGAPFVPSLAVRVPPRTTRSGAGPRGAAGRRSWVPARGRARDPRRRRDPRDRSAFHDAPEGRTSVMRGLRSDGPPDLRALGPPPRTRRASGAAGSASRLLVIAFPVRSRTSSRRGFAPGRARRRTPAPGGGARAPRGRLRAASRGLSCPCPWASCPPCDRLGPLGLGLPAPGLRLRARVPGASPIGDAPFPSAVRPDRGAPLAPLDAPPRAACRRAWPGHCCSVDPGSRRQARVPRPSQSFSVGRQSVLNERSHPGSLGPVDARLRASTSPVPATPGCPPFG